MKFDKELARRIDHTLLNPIAPISAYQKLVKEASEYGFAAVCVPPSILPFIADACSSANLTMATVIGFPLGYQSTETKRVEIQHCLELGATELDVVINLAFLKSGEWNLLAKELRHLREAASKNLLKIIIETVHLDEDEIIKICGICAESRVDYVKTSTGFAGGGATLKAVELMRANLPKEVKIKASGGIKNNKFALELIEAGADRLGCSGSVSVVSV